MGSDGDVEWNYSSEIYQEDINRGNITVMSDDETWRKYHTDYSILGGWMQQGTPNTCNCGPDGWIWVHKGGSNYGAYKTPITQEEYNNPYLINTTWSWGIYYVKGTNQVVEFGQFPSPYYPDSISYSKGYLSNIFNTTETTSDFSSELSGYLSTCTPTYGNCTIPLVFSSDSAGTIEVSDINIVYSITTATTTTTIPQNTCSDSDGGSNIYVKGNVSGVYYGYNYTSVDMCSTPDMIYEYICINYTTSYMSTLPCGSDYTCTDGACVSQIVNTTTTTTTTSTTILVTTTVPYNDCDTNCYSCLTYQYCMYSPAGCYWSGSYCYAPTIPTTTTTTTIPQNTCSDSDGGSNIYVKGNVSGVYYGYNYTSVDMCSTPDMIYEYICINYTTSYMSTLPCGSDYTCMDGACISQTTTTTTIPTNQTTTTSITTSTTITSTTITTSTSTTISTSTTTTSSTTTIPLSLSVTRILPSIAQPNTNLTVSLNLLILNESNKPNGIIIKEYVPIGWNLVSSAPTNDDFNSETGEIKWLLLSDAFYTRNLTYGISVPSNATGQVNFSGVVLYTFENNPVTLNIGGINALSVEYNADQDGNGKISDFELLNYISLWVQGLVDDFSLLEVVDRWAEGN